MFTPLYWLLLSPSPSSVVPIIRVTVAPQEMHYEIHLPPTPLEQKRVIDDRGFIVRESPWDRQLLELNPEKDRCDHTPPGPQFVADSRGYLCGRWEIDSTTRCCQSRYRYSCLACHNETKCCGVFSSCVTCCMRDKLSFDECDDRCRSSSRTLLLDDAPWLRLVPHCWHRPAKTAQSLDTAEAESACARCVGKVECCHAARNDCIVCCEQASYDNCTRQCSTAIVRVSEDVGEYRAYCSRASPENNNNSSVANATQVQWLDKL